MKLIRVQFLQATVTSPSRLRADNGEKHSVTVPYDYIDLEKQTDQLAETFCKRFYPEMTVRKVGTYKGQTFFELSSKRNLNVPAN